MCRRAIWVVGSWGAARGREGGKGREGSGGTNGRGRTRGRRGRAPGRSLIAVTSFSPIASTPPPPKNRSGRCIGGSPVSPALVFAFVAIIAQELIASVGVADSSRLPLIHHVAMEDTVVRITTMNQGIADIQTKAAKAALRAELSLLASQQQLPCSRNVLTRSL